MYRKILIATDGSALGGKALAHGLDLAKSVGASAVVVTVTESWPVLETGSEQYEKWAADYAGRVLADAAGAAEEVGVAHETFHIRDMHASEGILKAAEDAGCDLIVMSTHGRRGLDRLVLGSDAMKVLTYAKIPVLVVR